MRNLLISSILLFFSSTFILAQENENKYEDKVQSIDSIVPSIFEIVSGVKGEERNWELMKKVFHPQARLILNHQNSDGEPQIYFFNIEEYIDEFAASFKKMDLFEKEVHRVTNRFDNMAQVYSTYESFSFKEETKPQRRGMAGIQLYHDGERWWVLTMYWKNATEDNPIPEEYLSSSNN
jgi:hypothetical protein